MISCTIRFRNRYTDSRHDWVSELKSFDQLQAWISIEWKCSMTVINIKMKHCLNFLIFFTIFSCIEPSSENLWKLNKVVHINTEGYCRDVYISGDSVFVAAGQGGVSCGK
ncbi:MAG: hypothetical protein CM1200mP10_30080 [Candidatus Neomarinimicrobiota bacterium]|nr:MAG: hypothetical protein CM1200mP10_30080 [Candidatus Neomarinimicrobiota bacterium]